ncbi:Ketol-acid reductoisomerase [Limihaloglobus sulfuriphilus]|uniref:Ketol-acid reductoisomerase (NADP(+)) n=1 Tax=Limihaloglobus sulfuriphilus TaxID=1851148 RepID=A0A1Q2MD97_9BACT|nr:ketol-acid reductoisomerase [Limihaloglobus sulfuriphilus]AQQ70629.1 Ketol-acid reductoisomerase [Limihaloglobus sulfuriphilus]
MANVIYEDGAPIQPLMGKKVAVIGYGSQGHAHSQNLRDSGIEVSIAELEGTDNYKLAQEHGFSPSAIPSAIESAELIIITLPDEVQATVFESQIKPNLKPGQTLGFCHGFNIHFKYIVAPENTNVVMIAPKGPGHLVRSEYVKGGGVPCLVAVEQDASGTAKDIALAWANGIGGARAGIIETTYKEETETDLFGEQVVLCGGLTALIKAGFETLTEAGYQPEIAYFECMHEVKLIVDLMYQGGINYMRYSVSNTAEWGDLITGSKIITDQTKAKMKEILSEIQDGTFAKEWIEEYKSGLKNFNALYKADHDCQLEVVGRKLRKMMKWIDAKEV